ncbi:hypothetical protein HDU76_006308 [Blyttiomyces sp. JEL0837]|nr:hypothetical protein HDU76_006308 [Blyttiomyces sp. JEL0837]
MAIDMVDHGAQEEDAKVSLDLDHQISNANSKPRPAFLTSSPSSPSLEVLLAAAVEDKCPPCFDCHLPVFPCVHFSNCSDINGKCMCPTGFGGDDCSLPLCDSLADGDQRHPKPAGEDYCKCSDGWLGNNCNVCDSDDACNPMIIGNQNGTCYKSTLVVNQNFMQCQVTNEGVIERLRKSAEVTFTCDRREAECEFQFWVQGRESFYCHMSDCQYNGEHKVNKNTTTIRCEHMSCKCLPNRLLCGEPGSIDLTDWMVDKDEGPTGPVTYSCDEVEGDNGKRSCKFEGECLHVTQVPGYVRPLPTTAFTPLVIGLMTAVGLGLVALVLFAISYFQTQSERMQFDQIVGFDEVPGDEEGEDAIRLMNDESYRRALMAGHVPCSIMFRDLSYVISAKRGKHGNDKGIRAAFSSVAAVGDGIVDGTRRFFSRVGGSRYGVPGAGEDSENALLMDGEGEGVEAESVGGGSSAAGDEAAGGSGRRNKMVVLEGVHGFVKPGQVMAIMGGSGAGKTTFLDILARKNKSGKVKGEILINGKAMSADEYKSIIGYVDQEDTLMDTLTVYETILYSALLRLPRTMSLESKKSRVQETMMELDIVHIANRRIGSAGSRGISGGEKRRVSIACELVTSPSILFLDEPTSGLDSYNAYNVVECLGRMVYSGPAQEAAIEHFSSLGFNCPLGFNIADYLVDLTMHAIGTAGTPLDPSDPFSSNRPDSSDNAREGENTAPRASPVNTGGGHVRRRSSIRLQQEELLFTPRKPSATQQQTPMGGQLPSRLAEGGIVDESEEEDENPTPEFHVGSAPAHIDTLTRRNNASLDNLSPAPLRNAGKRNRKIKIGLGQLFAVDANVRNSIDGSRIANGISGVEATAGAGGAGGAAGEPEQEVDTNHLRVLVEGYNQSAVAKLIRDEIVVAVAAAASHPNGVSGPNTPRRGRSFSSVQSFRDTFAESNAASARVFNRMLGLSSTRATPWTQFKILSGRTFKNLYRNPNLLRTHYVISLFVALMCGLLFWKVFAAERLIFIRERANRYYQPITYFTSKIIFDMVPLRVVPPVILGLICYHMIGLRSEDAIFLGKFLLVLILFNLTAAACCMALSIVFWDASVATLIATLVMLFEMLFGGLLLNKGTVPKWAKWMQTFSFFNCALEALVVNEVNGLTLYETKFGLQIDVPGAVILQTFGFEARGYWTDVRRLCYMYIGFLALGFVWLQFVVKERR